MTQFITAFIGALGIAMLSNIHGRKLVYAGVGGLLSWVLSQLLTRLITTEAILIFSVSIAATLYAEIMARVEKSPATVFLVSAIFPILPGGKLYYTMIYAINSNIEQFAESAISAGYTSIAIAMGIMAVSSTFKIAKYIRKKVVVFFKKMW